MSYYGDTEYEEEAEESPDSDAPLCRGCQKPLTFCPMCGGNDDTIYAAQGQQDYYVCQDQNCDEYQFCCGC